MIIVSRILFIHIFALFPFFPLFPLPQPNKSPTSKMKSKPKIKSKANNHTIHPTPFNTYYTINNLLNYHYHLQELNSLLCFICIYIYIYILHTYKYLYICIYIYIYIHHPHHPPGKKQTRISLTILSPLHPTYKNLINQHLASPFTFLSFSSVSFHIPILLF